MNERGENKHSNGDRQGRIRAKGVVRIRRRKNRSSPKNESDPCIERECSSCERTVVLTVEQANEIPHDRTECAQCYRQTLADGFRALEQEGIILSSVEVDEDD